MSELKELTFIDDYTQLINGLLYGQFKNSRAPDVGKIINAFSLPFNEVEQVAEEIYTQLDLDNAVGEQLDGLGQIIGLPRNGLNDDDYRHALRIKILLNKSSGEPNIIIDAIRFFTGATEVILFEAFPAAMYAMANPQTLPPHIIPQIDRIALGGVKFFGITIFDDFEAFAFGTIVSEEVLELYDGSFLTLYNGSPLYITASADGTISETQKGKGFASVGSAYLELFDGTVLELFDGSLLTMTENSNILTEDAGQITNILQGESRHDIGYLQLYDDSVLELFDSSLLTININSY